MPAGRRRIHRKALVSFPMISSALDKKPRAKAFFATAVRRFNSKYQRLIPLLTNSPTVWPSDFTISVLNLPGFPRLSLAGFRRWRHVTRPPAWRTAAIIRSTSSGVRYSPGLPDSACGQGPVNFQSAICRKPGIRIQGTIGPASEIGPRLFASKQE